MHSSTIRLVEVGERLLHVAELELLVEDRAAGAVATFAGNVRDHDHGRPVATLTYEGHPSTEVALWEVAREVASQFELVALAIAHRVGHIPVGESALVAAVSAAHRGEAFAACSALVELTKERIPIWKRQVFADGTEEWVNCA